MDEKEIKAAISSFSGNIQAMYNLTDNLRRYLNFDLDINFESTSSIKRYTNVVRNMISRGLIRKPQKIGRTLMFDEKSFCQFLTARKYMASGCSFESLEGYLVDIPIDAIYERLFAKQLTDVDEVMSRTSASSQRDRSLSSRSESGSTSNSTLYRHIKVDTGLIMFIQQEPYTPEEIYDMVAMLKAYIKERPRRVSGNGEKFEDDDSDTYER